VSDAIVWHDVECGTYGADLPLWRELAESAGGPVLDLGAGTGRVALDLAARGHEVLAVDMDRELLDELRRRAARRGLQLEAVVADARELRLGRSVALAIAPMQLMQIVGGPDGRAAVLKRVREHLRPGGRFAAALAATHEAIAPDDPLPPLPDVGERDGWVFSSLPLDVRAEAGGVAVERLRQRVSPSGELTEERHTQLLEPLAPDQLEGEATRRGLVPGERRVIGATAEHVGSTVVICRR
jgi:SAM-dependent methyltransferase